MKNKEAGQWSKSRLIPYLEGMKGFLFSDEFLLIHCLLLLSEQDNFLYTFHKRIFGTIQKKIGSFDKTSVLHEMSRLTSLTNQTDF